QCLYHRRNLRRLCRVLLRRPPGLHQPRILHLHRVGHHSGHRRARRHGLPAGRYPGRHHHDPAAGDCPPVRRVPDAAVRPADGADDDLAPAGTAADETSASGAEIMSGAPLLEVSGLCMRFGGLLAVNEVALRVEEGQIVSLIGPNGAGKTTVFNCLTGFYKPSAGSIRFRGEEVSGLPGFKLARKGMVRTVQHVRLFKPSAGSIRFRGEEVSGLPGFKLARKGMVRTFQHVRLFKQMSVVENLLVAQHQHLNTNMLAGLFKTLNYRRAEREAMERAAWWL